MELAHEHDNAAKLLPAMGSEQHDGPYTAQSAAENRPEPASKDSEQSVGIEGVDMTEEATKRFETIDKNIFVRVTSDASKYEESIPCHCHYNPDKDDRSRACGESSDCINRLVQMECNPLTCPCGSYCLNRRFQKHQYAKVRIIDAGRKGFGMQALEDLDAGAFVMEYMGEVVTAGEFRKRARVYQSEGIQHHYFMSIGNGKVIDATRKGCIARFINHSCGPNCVLQKWMVGGAIRMGIFAERPIKRGEEITFDYKFERMADSEPQPCYCGSPACKGIIGVAKERSSGHTANADDEDADVADIDEELEDGAVTSHQRDDIRRRHAAVDDDDDEYGGSESDGSESDGSDAGRAASARRRKAGLTSPEQVLKFVQIMHRSSRQTRIIGILIGKLLETSDRRLLKSLIGLQGAGILRAWLQDYTGDDVMMIKILQCIAHMPISTRNTIDEARLEEVVKPLCTYSDENVSSLAATLIERWSGLRHVFKIPKKAKRDSTATAPSSSRQSPSQVQTPVEDPRVHSNSQSPGPLQNGMEPSHVRSSSPRPMGNEPGTYRQHGGAPGWGRGRGFRGSPPASHMRMSRSPARPPHSGYRQRYPPPRHGSRSRSPRGFRRPAHPRFGHHSAGDYTTPNRYPPGNGSYEPPGHHGSQSMPFSPPSSRGRFGGRWGGRGAHRRIPASERPYAAGSNFHERDHVEHRSEMTRSSNPPFEGRPRLPPGWRTAFTSDNIPYYYHETTKETRWDPPELPPAHADAGGDTMDGHYTPQRRNGNYRVDRWNSSSGNRSERGYDAEAPKVAAQSKVDDIIDRALRMGVQTPPNQSQQQLQPAASRPGTTQLVTPETDGEPPGASNASSKSQPAAALPASNSGVGSRRPSPDPGTAHEQPQAKRERLEKKAANELANFVVKTMTKYKSQMSHDEFKHEARKITKILLEKERKAAFDPSKLIDLSQHKRAKIKQFVADYMAKLLARQDRNSSATGS
ncbi:hypothetical protein IWW36_000213 [Coemansia brasiliensis]|uniref:[histone H3]-lysine(36) N-trimethyltransferase n=1 Tax=Coemansia brasiliensis TaxID=2650707 RepID=A0A9W8IBE4_9FUNG|nr:hypothetical protein IWW36_000213 [Coemansia brasiliensis]